MNRESIEHPFAPVWDENSRVLILGSLPSVRSRAEGFYYGHPRNRFWPLMALLFGEEVPQQTEEKRAFLLRHRIALWDAVQSCSIAGSADSSITNVVPTDLRPILTAASIQHIICNGKTAAGYYERLQQPLTKIPAIVLPSTSPANAAWSMERLAEAWRVLTEIL